MATITKYVFTIGGPNKGRSMVINGMYGFVDGVMEIYDRDTAEKISRTLCEFYGCTMEVVTISTDSPEPVKTSLAKEQTKKATTAANKTKQ